jgi:transposase
MDAHGMPVRVAVTAGSTADCTQAAALIDGIAAQFLLADRGYDTNESIDKALASGCEIGIPPKKNRKVRREYDKDIYRVRHLVENAFLHLKRWRGIATRHAKTLGSFVAAVQALHRALA